MGKNTVHLFGYVLPWLLLEEIGNVGIQERKASGSLEDRDGVEVISEVVNAVIPDSPNPFQTMSKYKYTSPMMTDAYLSPLLPSDLTVLTSQTSGPL